MGWNDCQKNTNCPENAYDDGVENTWDSSYDEIGNYWSDYSGTGYYYINGTAGSIDHYPNGYVPTITTTPTIVTSTTDTTITSTTDGLTNNTTTNGTPFEIPSEVILMISIGSASVIIIVVIVIIRGKQ